MSSATIDDLIIDANDLGIIGGSGVHSVVEYVPFKTNKVTGAGIQ